LVQTSQGANNHQKQEEKDENNNYREEDRVIPNKQAGRNLVNATNRRIELDQNEDYAENISELDD